MHISFGKLLLVLLIAICVFDAKQLPSLLNTMSDLIIRAKKAWMVMKHRFQDFLGS